MLGAAGYLCPHAELKIPVAVVSSPRLYSRYGRLGESDCASVLSMTGDVMRVCFSLTIQIIADAFIGGEAEAAVCI